ncbi:phosphoenolpyruvate--protein phosphotransferase [Tenggerimyces flavus]|uniref:Phosphocarrier protein HPr n=1 Tax=Tenggerimyces flavus TaxID=1708749 RepID=A0ABV7YBA2_9ACTN|nr:phosphoenolpyruvate--protein phosphotransferase [Tenggerimyces flavus]MBM7783590.1 phosphocarrier protein FPr [Tenggerimyces flavus]
MPVALVLVSHSTALAAGVRELASQMAPSVALVAAGGTDEGGVGTSFDMVLAAVLEAANPAGIVILYDLGSAQMTAELAIETLDPSEAALVHIVDAPLVEGALAAAITAQGGADLAAVVAAAQSANSATPAPPPTPTAPYQRAVFTLRNPLGLHARPAAQLASALAGLEATVTVGTEDGRQADARSLLAVVALSLRGGAEVAVTATGADAGAALTAIRALVDTGFGEGTDPTGTTPAPRAATHPATPPPPLASASDTAPPGTPTPDAAPTAPTGAASAATPAPGAPPEPTTPVAGMAEPSSAPGRAPTTSAAAGTTQRAAPQPTTPAAGTAQPGSAPSGAPATTSAAGVLRGVAGSPGIAVGPARWLRAADPDVSDQPVGDPTAERARLDAALAAVDRDLAATRAGVGSDAAAIAAAHRALLGDPALRDPAYAGIDAGHSASSAWWTAATTAATALAESDDQLVAERAADVRDVALAVLDALGVPTRGPLPDVHGAVVIATDVVPSQIAALARAGAKALVVAGGGKTAHATIIARGLGLPAVVALGRATDDIREGTPTIVDGSTGTVRLDPPATEVAEAQAAAAEEQQRRAEERAAAAAPVLDATGRHVLVAANVGSRPEAEAAVANGADGVGLLRTELLFLDRAELPTEDEQTAQLVDLLSVVGDRPVVVRTLDVGADKLLPALHLDPIKNGPLGQRGLRFGLAHLDILRTQIRAILRAAAGRKHLSVLAPMVTFAWEARTFRRLIADVSSELEDEGVAYGRPHEIGVMVEVPAAALAADEICAEVDFLSVGSNDLTQYVMAAERTNEAVASLYQPDHTALWRLYELLVASARAAGRRVAVCGEIAGDPAAAVRLVELGIDELSMAPASIPAVKAALRAALGTG